MIQTFEQLVAEIGAAVKPPVRITVSDSAAKYRVLNNPGATVGMWRNEVTPYLVEPMNILTSKDHTSMVFVGPAQSGKTDMVLNWIGHSCKFDPADMMVVQTSRTTSRDFSMRRIDRFHRHSPEFGKMLVPRGTSDNTFDKHYKSGMMLTLSWPTINELSGKPIPRLWLTDYDRMKQDVDGEGSPFDLSQTRATTFKMNGMTVAESSPGFVIDDPRWQPSTIHEAPPTRGILALYNRGDRRRWYWKCVYCHNAFEPDFSLMVYPDSDDIAECAEMATMRCPHCSLDYTHDDDDGTPSKQEMNNNARWIKDGMTWLPDDTMVGKPVRSEMASFWLKGVAAAFSDWKTLVTKQLDAEREYEQTGSEEALKTTVNTNQGMPYLPKKSGSARAPEGIMDLARPLELKVVPQGVRFIVATIDVQKHRFVVQMQGMTEQRDVHVIDRFDVQKSRRLDEDGERLWVNPASHPEDWKLLVDEVILKSYPLEGDDTRHMAVKYTFCDSGGELGVTTNAYNFYRWLRDGDKAKDASKATDYTWEPGMATRFMLVKGASMKSAPRVKVSYPDSQRTDRNAGARGEIPVMFMNTNILKDQVNNKLDRKTKGGRYVFSQLLGRNFFVELTVEVKDHKGNWTNPHSYRNESWDLLAYNEAALASPAINFELINWKNPPLWAEDWERNSLVFEIEADKKPFDMVKKTDYDLSKLGQDLG